MRKLLLALLSLALTSSVGAQSCCDADTVFPGGGLVLGHMAVSWAGAPAVGTVTLDAASEGNYWIMQVPKSGSITAMKFGTGTVTTGATLDCRLETVTAATGVPSGSLYGSSAAGTVAVVSGGADNGVEKTCTFATPATAVRGDFVAVKIAQPSVSAGNMTVVRLMTNASQAMAVPYVSDNTTGSYTLTAPGAPLLVSLVYSDGTLAQHPFVWQAYSTSSVGLTTATSPDEVGLSCRFPFNTYVTGMIFPRGNQNDPDMIVYDANSTALATYTNDGSMSQTGSTRSVAYMFSSRVAIRKGATYRFIMKGGAASTNIYWMITGSAASRAGTPGGEYCYYTSREDGGAWTDNTSLLTFISPILQ